MPNRTDVPDGVLRRLRRMCTALPEVREETAWAGIRWKVRTHTFAHVMVVDEESTPAFDPVKVLLRHPEDEICIVTFRSQGPELVALRNAGPPFFYAGWGRDVMALLLDDGTDWDEVRELLTESYCVLAPKKLVALVDRPDEPGGVADGELVEDDPFA